MSDSFMLYSSQLVMIDNNAKVKSVPGDSCLHTASFLARPLYYVKAIYVRHGHNLDGK